MKYRITIGIASSIIVYLIFSHVFPWYVDKYHGCAIYKDVYRQQIKSVVLDKFINSKNHYNETIIYNGKNNKEETMIFTAEFRGMYDFINEGDSIIKEVNSTYYKIKYNKTGRDTVIKFETTCKDTLPKRP